MNEKLERKNESKEGKSECDDLKRNKGKLRRKGCDV